MFRSEISFGFRLYQELREREPELEPARGGGGCWESLAIGCHEWQGGRAGNSSAEQGEEKDESEIQSGEAAIEHLCVYGPGSSL